jgi:hypothetical protein
MALGSCHVINNVAFANPCALYLLRDSTGAMITKNEKKPDNRLCVRKQKSEVLYADKAADRVNQGVSREVSRCLKPASVSLQEVY